MKAVVSVLGKDKKGIIARVSSELWKMNVNVEDISQTIMQDYFAMIMLVDLSEAEIEFAEISARLAELGKDVGVQIRIQNQTIFSAMHRI